MGKGRMALILVLAHFMAWGRMYHFPSICAAGLLRYSFAFRVVGAVAGCFRSSSWMGAGRVVGFLSFVGERGLLVVPLSVGREAGFVVGRSLTGFSRS